ncbi:transposase [Gaoshiqia sp. Z1-71]|uniref:transposase n=1 Tax=Gaoshiqia hydrogeniformans TaxID=3290090 RepID=UPI003BF890C3
MKVEPLTYGHYYHIYNRGNNSCNIFREADNYEHFLELYDKYISPVADTFAWVLMPNHFHLLVRIKEDVVYKFSNADRSNDAVRLEERLEKRSTNLSASEAPDSVKKSKHPKPALPDNTVWMETQKWETVSRSACEAPDSVKKPVPHRHFAHLFNAYTRYFNQRTGRTGNLFERAFKRKPINNEHYLKQVVLYIHNNPVHHGFCSHPLEYPWSSYLTCTSVKRTRLKRETVIAWFNDQRNFRFVHDEKVEIEKIETWLEMN